LDRGAPADPRDADGVGLLRGRLRARPRVSGVWREARARAVAEFRAVDGAGLRPVPTRAPRSDGLGQGGMSLDRAVMANLRAEPPPIAPHPFGVQLTLPRLALGTSAATLILIAAGGIVTSTGAGLAVPDWPATFGYNMFLFPWSRMVGGVLVEHSHRLLGSAVGVLVAGLTVVAWAGRCDRGLRAFTATALVLGCEI